MPDITISIVTYNNAQIIEDALTSIMKALDNKLSYQIYIIDNNSQDDTIHVLAKHKVNIELIPLKKNVGFGAGHNTVLDNISSKYHIVVNPDITVNHSVILDLYHYMEENPDIGLLTPKVVYPDGKQQYLCKNYPTLIDLLIRTFIPFAFKKRQVYFLMLDKNYNKPFLVPYATGCFMFFRTEVYKNINGFDERFFLHFEDADITRKVNQISKTVYYPYNCVIHDWKQESKKKPKHLLYKLISAYKYFKKWGFRVC